MGKYEYMYLINRLCYCLGGQRPDGLVGLYLKAFCTGLDRVLDGYRDSILQLETSVMKDPHLSVSHLVCNLQQVSYCLSHLGMCLSCTSLEILQLYVYDD
jgi:hypothetical protein